MEYRKVGKTDLNVSIVGLGGNVYGPPRLDQDNSTKNINRAMELGINFIDTAIGYGEGESENFIGNTLQGKRQNMVIATKFTLRTRKEGVSVKDHILSQAEESLTKLKTEYIDLYQIHMAVPGMAEEEVLEPLAKLVEDGKVRYLGESNYGAWRHAITNSIAESKGWPGMVSAQNHFNILRRHVELEIIPFCERFNIAFLPYFPLGGGFLTGKYQPGAEAPAGSRGAEGSGIISKTRNSRNEAVLANLEIFCSERGRSVLDLAFSWLLSHQCIPSVIAGTRLIEQIEANIEASKWNLSDEEIEEVNKIAAWDGTGEVVDGSVGGVGARAAVKQKT